jgi:hypothetical protein
LRDVSDLFAGRPVRVSYRADLSDTAGNPAYAATSIPTREIALDPELRRNRREHERILCHEYFHFAWVRLGNQRRWAWEKHLAAERKAGVRGEAGWSAEWRKKKLAPRDVRQRTRRWREYCCESFCDTGAWIKSGIATENTLAASARRARAAWFASQFGDAALLI